MSDMNENPMDKLARLASLLAAKANEVGLELQGFIPVPDITGSGTHAIQAVFAMVPEVAQAAVDDDDDTMKELQGIWEATEASEFESKKQEAKRKDEEKAAEAKERLLKMRQDFDEGNGILDD